MPRFLTDDEVERFRVQLVDAAVRIFMDLGVDGVTMRGLADEIGCSRQTPYRYFDNKDEILSAVRAAGFSKLCDRVERSMSRVDDPIERIVAVGRTYLRYAARNPELYRLMWSYSRDEPKKHPELNRQLLRSLNNLTTCFQAAIDAGRVRGSAKRLNVVFWSGLHGIVMLEIHASGSFGRAFDDVATDVMTTLLSGMDRPRKSSRRAG